MSSTPSPSTAARPQVTFLGDKRADVIDEKVAVYAVRGHIEARTGDREVSGVPYPFYEIPLLKRRYALEGGNVKLLPEWHDEIPRISPLTRSICREEVARLVRTYTMQREGGKLNLFEEVYGKGSSMRLYEVMRDQWKAFQRLQARKAAGEKVTHEDYEAILALAEPKVAEIDEADFPAVDLTMPGEAPANGDITTDEDRSPSDRLLDFLAQKGYDADMAVQIASSYFEHQTDEARRKAMLSIPEFAEKSKRVKVLADLDEFIKAEAVLV